ncbi:MAG TPA: carboxypeptidase-like regulatory domain-containing protein [Bryobacteraceae bacterium]|nr:carboxypeptidase-like regulatory domain-containing protein [Bryobacteraceae bacterium]
MPIQPGLRHVFGFLFLAIAGSFGGFSQSTTLLRGTVTDPQGAVIADAKVALSSANTGFNRSVLTNANGEYQFLQLSPGTYTVLAEAPGFSTLTRTDVQLLVNTPTTLDLRMELGKTTETVNVAAEASTINTVDASVGNAFSELQVRELPLETRNVVQLLSLQPGVTTNGEVLGARRDENNITLDGVDVNDNQNAGLVSQNTTTGTTYQGVNGNNYNVNSGFNSVLPIPLDSVQEFRVTVGGQGVDQGRSSGGQVVLVTKSGTNQLHGSLYEYNRNTATSANTWFNNQSGVPVQQLVRNQFGASIGGPIKKDRLFYFVNWEQRVDASSVAQVRAVPSETLKQGILQAQLTDGSVQTIGPSELPQIDPLGIGLNVPYQKILNQYPAGNDPAFGQDGGLNFSGYRFNAPDHLNDMAWVAKLDYKLDDAGKHTLSLRGTLGDNTIDQILAEFPGQAPASIQRDNNKGLSAHYTAILSPTLINSFTYGLTRLDENLSGVSGTGFQFEPTALSSLENWSARARGRVNPLNNFVDDVTWTKGKHTITMGANIRLNQNNTSTFTNAFPLYAYGATELIGLGEDIDTSVQTYLAGKLSNPNLQLANPTAVTNASASLLGILNDVFVTYQYKRNGQLLPQGTPQARSFIEHSYAGYIGDAWRVSRELTLNFGLRYENFRPPYEANGLQVDTTVPLNQYLAQRNGLQAQGVPANQMSDFTLAYALNGPVNGKSSWWSPDNANFAPRFGLAYAPTDHSGLIGKLFGKTGAFRVGAALAYDQFGNDLVVNYDQYGSLGLSNPTNFPDSYSFSTSPRFNGTYPDLPAAAAGGFPYTPPAIAAITGTFLGISPDLKTPYSIILNADYSRELPGKVTMEIGYVGRLSRRLLMQGDVYTPLENYKDPASGVTWQRNAQIVYNLANTLANGAGVPYNNAAALIAQEVMNNPGLVPNLPFVNNVWPGYKNFYFPGSASANYFYSVYGVFGSSFLDSLHAADRINGAYIPGKCLSVPGCYTFFAQQGSTMPMWMNAGEADFHGLTVTFRHRYSSGFQFDFNYTLSHSIDNGSAAESGAGEQGASIQNIYNLSAFRGSSDFDIRHNFNANFMYALPFGKGRPFLHNAPGWLDQAVGGWQISSVWRYSTALPSAVEGDLAYNSNYWLSSLAVMTTPTPSGGVHIDQNGIPSIFSNTSMSSNFQDQPPEGAGTRAAVRLAPIFNVDAALSKAFNLPWEGKRLQFRAEAFNAFNHPNFTNPSLSLQSPQTFGEFQGTLEPRSMQFALRLEF